MITVSSNDATGFVVDAITDTTSGPELTGREWARWKEKRNAVNRFLLGRGYRDVNANQKTGNLDGVGNTNVATGVNLTATHVRQSLLNVVGNGRPISSRCRNRRQAYAK